MIRIGGDGVIEDHEDEKEGLSVGDVSTIDQGGAEGGGGGH